MGKDASKEVTSSVEAFETRTRSPEEIGDDSIRARKALMKWFLVGARNLLKGVIPLNKRDRQFVVRHRQDFDVICHSQASDEERKKAPRVLVCVVCLYLQVINKIPYCK